jgi:hypothetical protein
LTIRTVSQNRECRDGRSENGQGDGHTTHSTARDQKTQRVGKKTRTTRKVRRSPDTHPGLALDWPTSPALRSAREIYFKDSDRNRSEFLAVFCVFLVSHYGRREKPECGKIGRRAYSTLSAKPRTWSTRTMVATRCCTIKTVAELL